MSDLIVSLKEIESKGKGYQSIQEAVNAAQEGIIVKVYPGTYLENVEIAKRITLKGVGNRAEIVLKGTIHVASDGVRLENFTIFNREEKGVPFQGAPVAIKLVSVKGVVIENVSIEFAKNIGIQMDSCRDVTIERCSISFSPSIGILLSNSDNNLILDNHLFANSWFGMRLSKSSGNRIENNEILRSSWIAINIHTLSEKNLVQGNFIMKGNVGINVSSCSNVICGNHISRTNHAIFVGRGPFTRSRKPDTSRTYDDKASEGNIVQKNFLTNNAKEGIILRGASRNTISDNIVNLSLLHGIVIFSMSNGNKVSGNIISDNHLDGLFVHSSSENRISGNVFKGNDVAVQLMSTDKNGLSNNAFLENRVDLLLSSTAKDSLPSEKLKVSVKEDKGRRNAKMMKRMVKAPDGKSYKIYWGDLHIHSELSDSAGTSDECYLYARDIMQLDFAALADHAESAVFKGSENMWGEIVKKAEEYNDPPNFITFSGYEVTYPCTLDGHFNIYYPHDRGKLYMVGNIITMTRDPVTGTPERLMNALKKDGQDYFIILHHFWMRENPDENYWYKTPQDPEHIIASDICSIHGIWEKRNDLDRNMQGRERTEATIQQGLSSGWKFAITANSDDHFGFGSTYALTAALIKEPTREGIIEALKSRRTYATTGNRIFLNFVMDGHMMGEEYRTQGVPNIQIQVENIKPLRRVDVIRNNETVYTRFCEDFKVKLEFKDEEIPKGQNFYYVRVTDIDGEKAWTSPIWVVKE